MDMTAYPFTAELFSTWEEIRMVVAIMFSAAL